jgi:hypothetical protein
MVVLRYEFTERVAKSDRCGVKSKGRCPFNSEGSLMGLPYGAALGDSIASPTPVCFDAEQVSLRIDCAIVGRRQHLEPVHVLVH